MALPKDALQSPMLAAALDYAANGIPVFVLSRSKVPFSGTHGHLDATLDAATITAWLSDPKKRNASLGIPMGAVSGLIVIEDDPRNAGGASLDLLEQRYGKLPDTYTVRSGSGGYHRYFLHPGVYIKSKANRFGDDYPGVDVKGDGGYVVAPPSIHQNGKRYEVAKAVAFAALPAAWLDALVASQPKPPELPAGAFKGTESYAGDGAKWLDWALNLKRDGTSDFYGFHLAIQLLANKCSDVEVWLHEYAIAATYDVSDPFVERDITRWLRSAGNSRIVQRGEPARSTKPAKTTKPAKVTPIREPEPEVTQAAPATSSTPPQETPGDAELLKGEPDDNGNAEAMCALFGHEYLWTPAYGWLRYTGTHWVAEPEPLVVKRAVVVLKARRHAAVDADNEAIVKATKQSRNNALNCVTLFKSYVTEADVSKFDADPDLLNVRNGVLNLRTGTLEPHSSAQRFTYCVPVEYNPKAEQTAWREFILDALGRDQAVADYFQVCAGYSITGHTREEKLFYLYGPPRAGKGTVTETLLALLPRPLGTGADFASFTAKRDNDSQNFDLAELKPSRIVIAGESNRYQALNPAKIKQVTGGDYVRCAFKHKDMFSYRPQFKVWLVSNHQVNADADDDALWSRVQVFNFPHSHLGSEDVTLKGRMRSPAVLQGVLAWCVEGARSWYKLERLAPPETVVEATQTHRAAQDYLQQWWEDNATVEPETWTPSGVLLKNYTTWCEQNGQKPARARDFSEALVKRFGCVFERKTGGVRGYKGVHVESNG